MKENKQEDIDNDLEELKGKVEGKNIVRIAGRPIEIYIYVILEKFQSFDQIEINVLDAYLERAIYIIRLWEALGIMPTNGYPIKFGKRKEEIISRGKEKYKGFVNTIILTKSPDQFRFTKD